MSSGELIGYFYRHGASLPHSGSTLGGLIRFSCRLGHIPLVECHLARIGRLALGVAPTLDAGFLLLRWSRLRNGRFRVISSRIGTARNGRVPTSPAAAPVLGNAAGREADENCGEEYAVTYRCLTSISVVFIKLAKPRCPHRYPIACSVEMPTQRDEPCADEHDFHRSG